MSVRNVLRHDLLVLRRSRLVWGALAALLLPIVGAFLSAVTTNPAEKTFIGISLMAFVVMILLPVTVLVLASLSIAGERESGTIRYLLGFPNDRHEIVLGKALSRLALVNGCLVVGFALVALFAVVLTDRSRLGAIVGFALVTMLFATSYVGLAVGVSAAATSQMRAIVAAAAGYAFWTVFWLPGFPLSASMFVTDELASLVGHPLDPSTVRLIEIINPPTAYLQSLQLLGGDSFDTLARVSSTTGALAPPVAIVAVLVAWTVVPLAFGYWRFRNADLS